MYTDEQKKPVRWPLVLLALLLIGLLCLAAFGGSEDALRLESERAIREAVERSARQCYAVEGIYPPDLAYLQAHYGLQVNTEDFYVVYDAFSSNLPPTVRVLSRNAGESQ